MGAGGHGLATAYYLGKNHGIKNVAIIEKGWLGGGNTGRNTTIIRSNYLQDPSAAIYDKALQLYETLSQDLNYNVMFSPRGLLMLAQTHHEVRGYLRTVHANQLQGVETRWIGPDEVKKLVPIISLDGPRYPVMGALYQPRGGTGRHDAVAWGYARACSDMGMDIIQNCEVRGVRSETAPSAALIRQGASSAARSWAMVVAGHSGQLAEMAGFRLPIEAVALQALVSEPIKALHGCGRDGQHRARLHEPVRQGRDGDRRWYRRFQQLYPARVLAPHRGNAARAGRDLPDAVAPQDAASMGRDRGHDGGPQPLISKTPLGNCFIQLRLGNGRVQGHSGVWLGDGRTHAKGEPGPLAAEFSMWRFKEGQFIDESVAAGVAH